jgi:uncharacterized protein
MRGMFSRRDVLALLSLGPALAARGAFAEPASLPPWASRLIAAAEGQVGVTTLYDPAYIRLAFPGGDVAPERGVCTDVIIRAYRDALGFDLQKAVNADMKRAFSAYPKRWGLRRPDPNIDHRRVENLRVFWRRRGAELPVPEDKAAWRPGDIVTQLLPGALPHVGIVTAKRSEDSGRLLVAHNIGAGARIEDVLARFEITGRYRFEPGLF